MASAPKFFGPKLIGRVRERAAALTYRNVIYRWSLAGNSTTRCMLAPPDLWPGDAASGLRMMQDGLGALALDADSLHGFDWLRDLRAHGGEAARQFARRVITDWINDYSKWRQGVWEPAVIGTRLASWLGFYEFYAGSHNGEPTAPDDFIARLQQVLTQQLRHLQRIVPGNLKGLAALQTIHGLLLAALNTSESEKILGFVHDWLLRELAALVLPDGGNATRSPQQQLAILQRLISIRQALQLAEITVPNDLGLAIQRMVPALRLLRHGDGALALFHGSQEHQELLIDSVITQSGARTRAAKSLPQMGYERVIGGRSLLLLDTGAPPPRGYDADAHAGLLAFEFSIGRERMIVNCGAAPKNDDNWQQALAATAAHSCLIIDSANAAEILPDGGVGRRPANVKAQRYEQDGMHYLDAEHDGYAAKHGLHHRRILGLQHDGELLMGKEILSGEAGHEIALRLHLHPAIQAVTGQSAQSILLRLPNGQGWRFRCEQHCGLEASVYAGSGSMQRSQQIVVYGRSHQESTIMNWVLQRETRS
jgi:uncharacterized heparinase superfamily protein